MYLAHTDTSATGLEVSNRLLSRRAAVGGIVLLKNDGTLPLKRCTVALYGAGARRTVKGGSGSGDVNERHVVSIEEGLEAAGYAIADKRWLDAYDKEFDEDRKDWKRELMLETERRGTHFDVVYLETPHLMPWGPVLKAGELPHADAAIYVVARRSSEGSDRRDLPGDYGLAAEERENIRLLARHYHRFVLMLNVPGPVDVSEFEDDPETNAIMLVSQGGLEMGSAVADVLSGAVCPSGHLGSTWARQYADYPGTDGFSYQGGPKVEYSEGIGVGYRWFDREGIDVLYPFGHGLSYAKFLCEVEELRSSDGGISLRVSARNEGRVPGRAVIQLYCEQPRGRIPKAPKVLAAFAKTGELACGASQTVELIVAWRDLASYDEGDRQWALEEGSYRFLLGLSSRDVACVASVAVPRRRTFPLGHSDRTTVAPSPQAARLVEGLSIEQRLSLVTGSAPADQLQTIGNAAVSVVGGAGETSHEVEGLPWVVMADGGSGLRLVPHFVVDNGGRLAPLDHMAALERGAFSDPPDEVVEGTDYYQYCTSFPIGTMLAQTWDTQLVREVGRGVACEMREFGVHLWLAPSVNIHRNPLCGRNFEYYSEDPLLAGVLASELCIGVQEGPGTGVCVKHYACNNQEFLRGQMDSVVSAQALREIYLRVFEIIVGRARPAAIMTSYNQVNGTHSANNRWLCTQVAREEWGFEGAFLTDWGTTHHGDSDAALCMHAGNDLIMPGRPRDRERIREAIERGEITEGDLNACASRVVDMVMRLARGYRSHILS